MVQGIFSVPGSKASSFKAASTNTWFALRGLLISLFMLTLVACGGLGAAPPDTVIEQAIVQQFEQTQQVLQQQLSFSKSDPLDLQISQVKVKRTQRTKGDPRTYCVQGTYTLSGKSANRALRRTRNPFEIYLQSQDQGQTWTLLPLQG
ncbi:MAG TPA: hypothetical protein V6D29_01230 [Leptolyngbyaceae cyanobacterium]